MARNSLRAGQTPPCAAGVPGSRSARRQAMRVLILGSGVIGTTMAYYLARTATR